MALPGERAFRWLCLSFIKGDEDDLFRKLVLHHMRAAGGDGDIRCFLHRITENAGGDGGEGDGFHLVFCRDGEGVPVTACEQICLALRPAMPDGADSVNDPSSGKAV